MAWAVFANETDLGATLGAWVETLDGGYDAPARDYAVQRLSGRLGAVLSSEPTASERQITITGRLTPTALTRAALDTAMDRFKSLMLRGLVTITVDDDVSTPRRIDGVCPRCVVTPLFHHVTTPVARFSATILCPDPTWYELQGSILSFSTTATPVPLGNAPSGGIIRIAAPKWSAASVTTPTLTYYSSGGASVKTLAFTGVTLVAEQDFLEVDLDRQTVVLSDAGVRSNAIANIASGDFFSLDPADGDYSQSAYPQLKVTAGAGTPVATLTYRKRWL